MTMDATSARIVDLSEWIDAGNAGRDREARTWGRLAKVTEECGELIEAYIGVTGQNPRKGVTHSMDQVRWELLDVALTALAALEHVQAETGQRRGTAMAMLYQHAVRVHARAGLEAL